MAYSNERHKYAARGDFYGVIDPGLFHLCKHAAVEDVRVRTVVDANGGSLFPAKGGRDNGACGLVDIDIVLICGSIDALSLLSAQLVEELVFPVLRAFPAIVQVMP